MSERYDRSLAATREFVDTGMYSSAFWRLFWRVGALLPGAEKIPTEELIKYVAWTNLSKTGLVGSSAPPDNDEDLRRIEVAQLEHEFTLLRPDIIFCVSGSLVPSIGYTLFSNWPAVPDLIPRTSATWIRRSPWGGALLWTMHPNFKGESWRQQVDADFCAILQHQSAL